jgi:hypothetical protein
MGLVADLDSFRTRYYRSETGKQSQEFLLSTLKSVSSPRISSYRTLRPSRSELRLVVLVTALA